MTLSTNKKEEEYITQLRPGLALLSLAGLALLGLAALGTRKVEVFEVEEEEEERSEARPDLLELICNTDQDGDPREWFPAMFPDDIEISLEGERLWQHHPFIISRTGYCAFSTTPSHLYAFDEEGTRLKLPWSEVRKVSVFRNAG